MKNLLTTLIICGFALVAFSQEQSKREQKGDKYYHSLFLTLIKPDTKEQFQEDFIEFIKTFKAPNIFPILGSQDKKKYKVSLVLPKQDAHFNKYDIYGDNDID